MERWGGVRGFEVVLRRREVERVDTSTGGHGGGGVVGERRSLRFSQAKGQELCFGEGDEEGDDSNSTVSVSVSDSSKDAHDDENDDLPADDDDHSTCRTSKSRSKSHRRKKPLIEPAPVPSWLRQEVGPNKSFDDIRGIINRLLEYLTVLREEGRKERIRFPDIEILPSFQGWVLEKEKEKERARVGHQGGQKKRGKRVSERGAVQKV